MSKLGGGVVENNTFFSTAEFATTWTSVFVGRGSPLRIPVGGSGPARAMYGSQVTGRFGLRTITLSPGDFFASPGWDGALEPATLDGIVARIAGGRTRYISWTIRYDHTALVPGLEAHGFVARRVPTHVLALHGDYPGTFARYNATMRNQVRKAARAGVVVRDAQSPADVDSYYRIHEQVVASKESWNHVYPVDYFHQILRVAGAARLLVAEYEGRIVAGGLFYRDGCSVMYAHGSADRAYSHAYPTCAVVDAAIQWAETIGANSFNFGGSNGIVSLEKFKEYWGAEVRHNWILEWNNPVLSRAAALKAGVKQLLHLSPARGNLDGPLGFAMPLH
jgi:hypothetical protein